MVFVKYDCQIIIILLLHNIWLYWNIMILFNKMINMFSFVMILLIFLLLDLTLPFQPLSKVIRIKNLTFFLFFFFFFDIGSSWSLSCRLIWRYKFVRYSCQACYHHAQRYSTGSTNPWRACLSSWKTLKFMIYLW